MRVRILQTRVGPTGKMRHGEIHDFDDDRANRLIAAGQVEAAPDEPLTVKRAKPSPATLAKAAGETPEAPASEAPASIDEVLEQTEQIGDATDTPREAVEHPADGTMSPAIEGEAPAAEEPEATPEAPAAAAEVEATPEVEETPAEPEAAPAVEEVAAPVVVDVDAQVALLVDSNTRESLNKIAKKAKVKDFEKMKSKPEVAKAIVEAELAKG